MWYNWGMNTLPTDSRGRTRYMLTSGERTALKKKRIIRAAVEAIAAGGTIEAVAKDLGYTTTDVTLAVVDSEYSNTIYEIGKTFSSSARNEEYKFSLSFQSSNTGQWIWGGEAADEATFQAPVWNEGSANATCP